MKLIPIFVCMFLASNARADWKLPKFNTSIFSSKSSNDLRVVWSCPTENRGEMPKEKEVRISYDVSGKVKFKPNIFKQGFNLVNLFKKKRSSSDVDQCLKTFLDTLPQAIS